MVTEGLIYNFDMTEAFGPAFHERWSQIKLAMVLQ